MKFSGFSSQVIVSIFFLGFSITYHLFPIHSLAQDSSPSGSLLQKLNELKEDIASKAAQIKTQVNKKVRNKAIIGTILDIQPDEITVQTLSSAKTVKYDEFTQVIGAKNKEIKISTLETSDNIAALGDFDDRNNLVAQRLVFLESDSWRTASNSAQMVWGQIQKSQGSSITLKTKSGEVENISINSQTQFFLGSEEASINDAKVEKNLIARTTRQKDGSLRARFIYFIPSMSFLKPTTKDSSPSAKAKNND